MSGTSAKIGKQRKDTYYRLAKENGFRSRAVFKLIQLDERFEFLKGSRKILDLCAAPGSWLQYLSKRFSQGKSAKILGIDLSQIQAIKGVATRVCDITTPECSDLIESFFYSKVDLILHDGSPNLGTAWIRDSRIQNELVLKSLSLAMKHLQTGGIFVSKIFRGDDFLKTLTVIKEFFASVSISKPKSSRPESSETFIVAKGFFGPDGSGKTGLQIVAEKTEEVEESLATNDRGTRRRVEGYTRDLYRRRAVPVAQLLASGDKHEMTELLINSDTVEIDRFEEEIPEDIKILSGDLQIINKIERRKLVSFFLALQKKLVKKAETEEKDVESECEEQDMRSDWEQDTAWEKKHMRKVLEDMKKEDDKESLRVSRKEDILREREEKEKQYFLERETSSFFQHNVFLETRNLKDKNIDMSKKMRDNPVKNTLSEKISLDEIECILRIRRNKEEFIEDAVGKNWNTGEENLPQFFVEDEEKHRKLKLHISEEAYEIYRELSKKGSTRPASLEHQVVIKKIDMQIHRLSEEIMAADIVDPVKIAKLKRMLLAKKKKRSRRRLIVSTKKTQGKIPHVKGRIKMVDSRTRKDLPRSKKARKKLGIK